VYVRLGDTIGPTATALDDAGGYNVEADGPRVIGRVGGEDGHLSVSGS